MAYILENIGQPFKHGPWSMFDSKCLHLMNSRWQKLKNRIWVKNKQLTVYV